MRRSSNNNVNGGQSSATTAGTNEGRLDHNSSQIELQESDDEVETPKEEPPKEAFDITKETGQRGAKPESNQILTEEVNLVGSKKEKMIEVFRNCTEIREMIVS